MSSKSSFLCSNCPKILKKPVTFTCGCTVCGEHLDDKEATKTKTIKCVKCNIEYNLNEINFKPNKLVEDLLNQNVYLTEEEKSFKTKLSQSLTDLHNIFDELREKKTMLEVEIYDHFVELRRQIDIRREEAKARIDDISMQMIELSQNVEAQYMDRLKKTFIRSEEESFERRKNDFEEKFRDPKLLIQSLHAIRANQDKEIAQLKEFKSEFDEIARLVKGNKFKAGAVFGKELFGDLSLVECAKLDLNSKIVTDQQWIELMRLCEFSSEEKWTLLYRASIHGFGTTDFHSNCDGHSNTLTIIKPVNSTNIFGGFTSVPWDNNSSEFKTDDSAFIFSLINNDNKPIKIKPKAFINAIYCDSSYGPTFGDEINIRNDSNKNSNSKSNLGSSYTHPQYAYKSAEAKSFLAGSEYFQVSEIEVFSRI